MTFEIPTEIDREGVLSLMEGGAQLVEVLSPSEYESIHLAGARNIPLSRIDRTVTADLQPDQPVILYCSDYQ